MTHISCITLNELSLPSSDLYAQTRSYVHADTFILYVFVLAGSDPRMSYTYFRIIKVFLLLNCLTIYAYCFQIVTLLTTTEMYASAVKCISGATN